MLFTLTMSTGALGVAQNEFSGVLIAKAKEKKKSGAETAEQSSDAKNAPCDDAKTTSSDKKKDASSKPELEAKSANEPADGEHATRTFSGNVSWYGIPFHGKKTASGEIFDMFKLSAAHLTLPLPTRCIVEDPRSGNAVIVKVNDRGPYVKTRVMDLSREAARELGTLPRGVAYVDITVLESKHKPKSKG